MVGRGLRALRKLANKERVEAGLPPDHRPIEGGRIARKLASRPQGCSKPRACFTSVPDGLFARCPACRANNFRSNGTCRKCGKKMGD